jgi:hypothetical protein
VTPGDGYRDAGRLAERTGKLPAANPHDPLSDAGRAWDEGFLSSRLRSADPTVLRRAMNALRYFPLDRILAEHATKEGS